MGFLSSSFVGAVALLIVAASGSDLQTYKNENWGFSVTLPSSVRYETSRPPNPNHGFQVHVSRDSFVWVNADSSDDLSLSEAVETEKGLWVGQGCREIKRAPVPLGGRSAEQIQMDCPAGLAQKEVKRVSLIVALQAPPGINNTAYTVGVAYPKTGTDEQSALRTFDAVRQGFQFNGPELR